ncbi:hypothetical protein [Roseisolibacter agri]|uniref:Uncharacterized protein n=1 Tax=Roseisolibacter agri TaxID=2014610 RepID=A0AA37Q1Q0_9BACT|nr:hypothetical protein [Roseisolibacter agri]GLC24744.1 hypothetical protein rosag_12570 [Roseisolibacter agri]
MRQPAPRPRLRTLALPPSLRRPARARRSSPRGWCLPSHAVLRAALRTLLALPPESARDADRAVALIMRRVRADA